MDLGLYEIVIKFLFWRSDDMLFNNFLFKTFIEDGIFFLDIFLSVTKLFLFIVNFFLDSYYVYSLLYNCFFFLILVLVLLFNLAEGELKSKTYFF